MRIDPVQQYEQKVSDLFDQIVTLLSSYPKEQFELAQGYVTKERDNYDTYQLERILRTAKNLRGMDVYADTINAVMEVHTLYLREGRSKLRTAQTQSIDAAGPLALDMEVTQEVMQQQELPMEGIDKPQPESTPPVEPPAVEEVVTVELQEVVTIEAPPPPPKPYQPEPEEPRLRWLIETMYGVEVPLLVEVNANGNIDCIRIGTADLIKVFKADPIKVLELKCTKTTARLPNDHPVQLVNITHLHSVLEDPEYCDKVARSWVEVYHKIAKGLTEAQDTHAPFNNVFLNYRYILPQEDPTTTEDPTPAVDIEVEHDADAFHTYMRGPDRTTAVVSGVSGLHMLLEAIVACARKHNGSGLYYAYTTPTVEKKSNGEEELVDGIYEHIEPRLTEDLLNQPIPFGKYPWWKNRINKGKDKLNQWGLLMGRVERRELTKELGLGKNIILMTEFAHQEMVDYLSEVNTTDE